ncbi:MAG: glycosyltransferase [Lyngbya sp. HA4199-MV5]|jgi:glycosyltransferase involved in cell wall biosynthesis|nr:glycosyltransferase [Lyngbya sp. HA4199-MV5]
MKLQPLVSVVVTSYNYARFLRQAIDSVLTQTYSNLEVIVVDDGSTDESRSVIARYGDRVIPVLKENGGQGSAWNAGFDVAKGDIILLLDSDDVFLPDVAQRVVDAFHQHPGTAKVQWRLHLMDVNGKRLGRTSPLERRRMPTGDLRPRIYNYPNYVWPPTSGNAFSATALRQILPIPEDTYRLSPDIYVNVLMPLFGAVVSLVEPGALYRKHDKNNGITTGTVEQAIDLIEFRRNLVNTAALHQKRKELVGTIAAKVENRDSKFLIGRMISKKVDPEHHPCPDRVFSVCWNGIITSLTEPGTYVYQKLFNVAWFVMMLFASKDVAWKLANSLIYPNYRHPLINQFLKWVRKTQKVEPQPQS